VFYQRLFCFTLLRQLSAFFTITTTVTVIAVTAVTAVTTVTTATAITATVIIFGLLLF
jgi:hypothetical protein